MNTEQKPTVKRTKRKLLVYQAHFDGQTYQQIAQLEGVNYDAGYLANMLAPTGKWYNDYLLWASDKTDAIEKEVRIRIKKRMDEAMVVQEYMLTLAKTNPKEAARAARDLLDRGGLKAPEKVEVTNPYDHAEQLAQWIEGRNKPKQPHE